MNFKIEKNDNDNGKIDYRLKQAAAETPVSMADDILLSAFIRASTPLTLRGQTLLDAEGVAVKGAIVNHIAGDIYTARLSPNSLKTLEADTRIASVQGGQKLRPL